MVIIGPELGQSVIINDDTKGQLEVIYQGIVHAEREAERTARLEVQAFIRKLNTQASTVAEQRADEISQPEGSDGTTADPALQ